MIRNTFCHIPSISTGVESALWQTGVRSWDDCLSASIKLLTPNQLGRLHQFIDQSLVALGANDAEYFTALLPSNQHWRLFREFRHSAAYIDIETTGMGVFDGSYITTIALYDGSTIRYYVHGQNLQDFPNDIQQYDLIVTYNGKCFDVPFIERYFRMRLRAAHIDLRYVLKSLGYAGGLKGCERMLGLDRGELDGVDGFFAVLLWDEYRRTNDTKALETLLAYNIEDVVNLEILMIMAYNMKLESTPFVRINKIELPPTPELPFSPDVKTIGRIRKRIVSWQEF
jgi:uncharacterized protein YprB with RNaseH-like and TPR domain